jgi:hypothetical protein
MSVTSRPQKITFADMREQGARGILVCCADYTGSHSIALSADRWPDDLQLSDLEPRFICKACGKRGADVRPDFNRSRTPVRQKGLSMRFVERLPFADPHVAARKLVEIAIALGWVWRHESGT